MRTSVSAAIAALAILTLASCSASSTDTETPTPTSSVAEPSTEPHTGTSLDELREMYIDAGGECDVLTPDEQTGLAAESGVCDSGTILSTYAHTSQTETAIAILQGRNATNTTQRDIAVGRDWIVDGADAGEVADAMLGGTRQVGFPDRTTDVVVDLTTDSGLCAADAEMTNLELNDALAPILGYPADRDLRTSEQDDAIRAYKNAAFERACPARAG